MTDHKTLNQFMAQYRPLIEKQLRTTLRLQRVQAESLSNEYQDLLHELSTLLKRGGKRLRPLLYILAYEGYGGQRRSSAIQVAVALELVHVFLLIHDDIIDRDYQRWGGPNIIGVYYEKFARSMDSRDALHAAEARALLAGDICLSLAHEQLAASGFEAKTILAMQQLLTQSVTTVIAGELTDMSQSYAKKLPAEKEVLDMYAAKTASYSFVLPMVAAAHCAGNEHDITLLQDISKQLGIAYQLQDDLLGVFGTSEITGKSQVSDLREAKRTVLLIKTFELSDARQKRILQEVIGNDNLEARDITAVQEIMIASGAKTYTEQLIAEHSRQAIVLIQNSNLKPTQKSWLIEMSEQCVGRSN